jgi:toxin ParE1/3/4
MKPPYELRYHPAAEDDLVEIFTLIRDYAGIDSATRKLQAIERVTKSLTDFLYKGTVRDEVLAGLRAIPAAAKAVICFTIHEDEHSVVILSVGYAGSDWAARVKGRL